MTKSAESFYTSIGFPSLPQTFWERSMLTRPRDREVVCHASAWDMDDKDDVRIKMCMRPLEEDLFTIYHELGHVYYFIWYKDQPQLFQDGAHDGFHEAIGDAVNLSVTPGYLHQIGLVERGEALAGGGDQPADEDGAGQGRLPAVRQAHRRVALGRVQRRDQAGRLQQGLVGAAREVPGRRRRRCRAAKQDFDPGAKYHIPGNTPYTRYFLSFILQFQFHKALCDAAGFKGPLHECSIFGSKEAGAKLRRHAGARRQPAVARYAGETHRHAQDGRLGHHRLLQAARSLARQTEPGPVLRLELSSRR